MPSDLSPLQDYSQESITASFSRLLLALEADAAAVRKYDDIDKFRLRWDGTKQGRIPDVNKIWLRSAPTLEARRDISSRFEKLKARYKQEYEGIQVRFILAVADSSPASKQKILTAIQNITKLDITLPGTVRAPGIAHPLLNTMERVVEVFHNLGYSTQLGPQVETDFFNFEALNFPPNHPARDTQDTLQIAAQSAKPGRDRLLMRTHTSPVQIRTMLRQDPPLRIVIPGKVHRNDAADATHSPIFHQVEGLAVGPDVTFSDLKGTLAHAMRALFGASVKTRFFPSFFPFTEPSADVQISCIFCNGRGCRKCKHSGWIELLGCGMVDPAVFTAVADERRRLGLDPAPYDPARVSGFAFGMGVERIAMILHGVSDIGLFYSGDMRFLEQFA
jgi:phenylalanyl-tRNA synthetase alpha chain